MSRINDLIQELCPDGVIFEPLSKLFNIKNGYTPAKSNAAFWDGTGTVPWFRMEDIRRNGRILDHAIQTIPLNAAKNGILFPANSLLIATSATIGEHALITVPHLSNQRFMSLSLKTAYKELLNIKFLYYYFFILDEWCLKNTSFSSFASVNMSKFKRFQIPIPPMEIQEEIVRILDSFTSLEAELEAELEARRKQYIYYESYLTIFNPNNPNLQWLSLAEMEDRGLVKLGRGMIISKEDIANNPGNYPVYSASASDTGELGRYGSYLFDDERITWSIDGGGRFYYRPAERYSVTNVSGWLKVLNDSISTKFLYYQLDALWRKMHFNYVKKAHPSVIKNQYTVALPPREEQDIIATTLDKFHTFTSNLSSGLPAEIEARHKQYEYYRDRLLTFKELGHE